MVSSLSSSSIHIGAITVHLKMAVIHIGVTGALAAVVAFERFTLLHLLCDIAHKVHGASSNELRRWVVERRQAHAVRFFGAVGKPEQQGVDWSLVDRVVGVTKLVCRDPEGFKRPEAHFV